MPYAAYEPSKKTDGERRLQDELSVRHRKPDRRPDHPQVLLCASDTMEPLADSYQVK